MIFINIFALTFLYFFSSDEEDIPLVLTQEVDENETVRSAFSNVEKQKRYILIEFKKHTLHNA